MFLFLLQFSFLPFLIIVCSTVEDLFGFGGSTCGVFAGEQGVLELGCRFDRGANCWGRSDGYRNFEEAQVAGVCSRFGFRRGFGPFLWRFPFVTWVLQKSVYSILFHSNGALLQVLIGSYFSEKLPKANAIISYNNRPATEAVPYFEQLGPLLSQVMPIMEAFPLYSMAKSASDAWRVLLDTAGAMTSDYDPEAMVSLNKFVHQLPSVFNQVAQGMSEFRPTPSENRHCFKKSYNIQKTLLVKFNFDAIDETDLLEETLNSRVESIGGTLEKVSLSGNHITPCIQEPKLQVGYVYTPADAIAQGLKTLSLNDTKVLSRTITDWFNRLQE